MGCSIVFTSKQFVLIHTNCPFLITDRVAALADGSQRFCNAQISYISHTKPLTANRRLLSLTARLRTASITPMLKRSLALFIVLSPVVLSGIFPSAAAGATLAEELNVAEPERLGISYTWSLERAVVALDRSASAEIAEGSTLYADPAQNDFVLIQHFFHAPPFKPLQWMIVPEAKGKVPASSAQMVALDPVSWMAFAELIKPPFPQVRLSAPANEYFSNPISFTRVLIKTGDYSGVHYYITPRAAIRSESWAPPFNSEEGWQNALRLLYALDNVRMVSGSDVFRAVADFRTLGEVYLNGLEHLLLAAAHHSHPNLSSNDALKAAANKLLEIEPAKTKEPEKNPPEPAQ